MSKSRLEKFLYALYSLDSSDLPTPLSRIEELYNCWVTGADIPTFEPLSRVEKYLMAILGVYDVNKLPNPISRVEVLLHKLAIGDDNLDDVKSFLSEHEELLAEIIRNGGAGGNIDIEYVLYTLSTEFNTLYNTAEKPVKSAILKGNTLVNLAGWNNIKNLDYVLISNNMAIINFEDYYASTTIKTANMIKQNTTYTLIIDSKVTKSEVDGYSNPPRQNGMVIQFTDGTVQTPMTSFQNVGERVLQKVVFTVENKKIKQIYMRFFTASLATSGVCQGEVYSVMLIEGDYTNTDIPYFEGMQSVKMPVLTTTGKNLLDVTILDEESEGSGWSYKRQGETMEFISDGANAYQMYLRDITSDLINKLKVGKTYTLSSDITLLTEAKSSVQIAITYVDGTYDYIESHANGSYSIEIKQKIKQIRFRLVGQNSSNASTSHLIVKNIQLEESSTPTTYEPYKTNILTTSEEVELRGIGDVKDELNLITGELTQHVGEVVLNGSENWELPNWDSENHLSFIYYFGSRIIGVISKGISDKLPFQSWIDLNTKDIQGFTYGDAGIGSYVVFKINKTIVSNLIAFKSWLAQNPIKIQYLNYQESVKTVDLSVVDQDGNNTKLSTFDDLTHVTLSSEGLIPEAELEVATKNEEVLNTMSLEMDDISATQTTLDETSNTQSENVDATMIATTEIYEQLL